MYVCYLNFYDMRSAKIKTAKTLGWKAACFPIPTSQRKALPTMTTTRKPAPVHVILVLGTPNLMRARRANRDAFRTDALIRTPGTRNYCPAGFVGKRDGETYPATREGDVAWADHCSRTFGAADDHAASEAAALDLLIDTTGGTLTVVQSIDWDQHVPSKGIYCGIPARDTWAQLAELADLTITA